jgi:hypothetical protein
MKALLALLLTGCVSVTPIHGMDGRVFYSIDCRGDEMKCLMAAGKMCKEDGYRIISYKDEGLPNYSGELMVRCGQK